MSIIKKIKVNNVSYDISSSSTVSTSNIELQNDDSTANFNIGDINGNIIVQFKDGHIKTKNFDSSKNGSVDKVYSDRPSTGFENFYVLVNYKDTYTNISVSNNNVEDNIDCVYKDYCIIGLPENYSKNGDPVRLIIHCGGTGERITSVTNPIASNFHGWKYFLAKGYAVLDCNGIADEYISTKRGGGSKNHFGCKFLLQSYKKAYDYVIKKYNVYSDGCFVSGISMGGLSSFMIVQSGLIPVLAQAGICPCIDIFKQSFLNPWSDQKNMTPIDYNFDTKLENESEKEWFVRNIDKITGYNNLTKNTFGDKTGIYDYFDGSEENDVYNKLSKYYPCPLKIWHCKNDSTVVYRYSKYIINMIRNAGGVAELHSYDDGGHGAWSFGSIIDEDGISTSITFYEVIKFFKRFSK